MLTATVGAPFDVELGATPTTGYVWELVSPPAGVQLLGSDFKLPRAAPIGGGGTQVFHLQVDRPGREHERQAGGRAEQLAERHEMS